MTLNDLERRNGLTCARRVISAVAEPIVLAVFSSVLMWRVVLAWLGRHSGTSKVDFLLMVYQCI